MIKIEIGGWPFNVPQRWGEVSFEQGLKLYNEPDLEYAKHVEILAAIPSSEAIKLPVGVTFAVYELLSFIEDLPEVVTNEVEVPPLAKWTFAQYELCRKAIAKHPKQVALSFARITEILYSPPELNTKNLSKQKAEKAKATHAMEVAEYNRHKKHFVEIGAKAVDIILKYIESWGDYMESDPPTDKEIDAGIERLQAFGVYSILEKVAAKYGRLPKEIEEESAAWVLTEWIYLQETNKFASEYQLQNKTT